MTIRDRERERDRERDGYYSDRNELIRERERERERDRGYLSDHNSRYPPFSYSHLYNITNQILKIFHKLCIVTMRNVHWRVGTGSVVPSFRRMAFGQLDAWLRIGSRNFDIAE